MKLTADYFLQFEGWQMEIMETQGDESKLYTRARMTGATEDGHGNVIFELELAVKKLLGPTVLPVLNQGWSRSELTAYKVSADRSSAPLDGEHPHQQYYIRPDMDTMIVLYSSNSKARLVDLELVWGLKKEEPKEGEPAKTSAA